MKIDDICLSVVFVSNKIKYYYLFYSDSLKWIKYKLDNKMISEEEYLKELLMIKTDSKRMCLFDIDGNFIRNSNNLKCWRVNGDENHGYHQKYT